MLSWPKEATCDRQHAPAEAQLLTRCCWQDGNACQGHPQACSLATPPDSFPKEVRTSQALVRWLQQSVHPGQACRPALRGPGPQHQGGAAAVQQPACTTHNTCLLRVHFHLLVLHSTCAHSASSTLLACMLSTNACYCTDVFNKLHRIRCLHKITTQNCTASCSRLMLAS